MLTCVHASMFNTHATRARKSCIVFRLYQFRNNMFADYHAVTMNLLVEFKKAKSGVTKKEAMTRRCDILKSKMALDN